MIHVNFGPQPAKTLTERCMILGPMEESRQWRDGQHHHQHGKDLRGVMLEFISNACAQSEDQGEAKLAAEPCT
jgi:hypothetical protein